MKNDSTPELRFPGFTDNWKQLKLSNVAEKFEYGLNAAAKKYDGKYKYIRITDIDDDTRKFSLKNLTSPDIDVDEAEAYILKQGDILFARTGASTGKSYIYEDKDGLVYYAGFLIRARIKEEYNANFIFQNTLTVKYNNYIKVASQRSGQPGVNAQEYAEFQIMVPSLNEQIKISDFFKKFDNIIALYQQELDNMKQMKQGFLQKMFPKEGESVPELRFQGFNGEWKRRKLGEVVKITMGQSPDGKNYTDNPEDYILVQGNADLKDGKVVPRVYTTQITKTASKGDLILSVRAPVGAIGKTDYNVVLGRGVAGIEGNEFIYQTLLKMNLCGYWKYYSVGSTFDSINSNDLKNAEILVPNNSEQNAIGQFFKQIDDNIALHQHNLELLKETKKAFLQKMFV